ncbi:putative Laccase-2-like protein 4 [Seiridium cardinale]|uniref:Laccase-2-like protein 4 n=1 Tax=Seiridium cardinale TaxID=138064 RepID=A0ABR2XCK9_9PEZI
MSAEIFDRAVEYPARTSPNFNGSSGYAVSAPSSSPSGSSTNVVVSYSGSLTASGVAASTSPTSTSLSHSGYSTASLNTTYTASISNSTSSTTASSSVSVTSSSASASATTTTYGNTANTRSQWGPYSIDTDYYNEVPDTGVTREFWFEVVEGTYSPDGVDRYGITINGSIPGPEITADWGDNVIVHVTNSLADSLNGTSLHFHGIRQNYTNDQDGVSSITQCPTAPGESITYKWRATQYGTTWYHSHFALQAWAGVFGPIVINGPASANYDEDMGIVFLNDWTHQTPDELFVQAETRGPPNQDNGLINGVNVWGDDDSADQVGERWSATFVSGTSYRLRIVSGAMDSTFKFSIDNHTLQVIASDLVPIEPYDTTILSVGGGKHFSSLLSRPQYTTSTTVNITRSSIQSNAMFTNSYTPLTRMSIGQRYDVIVTANQGHIADSFWMRAIPQASCSTNTQQTNIKGVIYYDSSTTVPSTTGYDYTDGCDDETANLVPVVPWTVGLASTETVEVAKVAPYSSGGLRWFLNSTTMITDWGNPSLVQIESDDSDFATSDAVIMLDEANVWTYLVIETTMTVAHPIHLHGHDFVILAQGTGSFDDSVTLNMDNPPRRDVAMLPSGGYLAVAFFTDNPGAWLMHCHIGWHTSEGFALQFIERESEIMSTVDTDRLQDTCTAWNNHQDSNSIVQDDSGI